MKAIFLCIALLGFSFMSCGQHPVGENETTLPQWGALNYPLTPVPLPDTVGIGHYTGLCPHCNAR